MIQPMRETRLRLLTLMESLPPLFVFLRPISATSLLVQMAAISILAIRSSMWPRPSCLSPMLFLPAPLAAAWRTY